MSEVPASPPVVKTVQNALTLVMTIKSETDYQQLHALLYGIQSKPRDQNPVWQALTKLKTVHFARFVFLSNNTQIAGITTYDGTFEHYVNEFTDSVGDIFNAILAHVTEAPPLPVQQHRAEFLAYVKANDLGCIQPFFSAYPTATVLDIQDALDQS
jgi:hypothetical protein